MFVVGTRGLRVRRQGIAARLTPLPQLVLSPLCLSPAIDMEMSPGSICKSGRNN